METECLTAIVELYLTSSIGAVMARTITAYIGYNARRLHSSLLSALFSHRVVHTTALGGYRHLQK